MISRPEAYHDLYDAAYAALTHAGRAGFWPAFAFSGNVDLWMEKGLQHFLEWADVTTLEVTLPRRHIASERDFLASWQHYARQGLGAEAVTTQGALIQQLMEASPYQKQLGGTASQGAAALAAFGLPNLLAFPDHSAAMLELFEGKAIYSVHEGALIPSSHLPVCGEPALHLVFQSQRGETYMSSAGPQQIPQGNRFILDYDPYLANFPLDTAFMRYVLEHADQITSLNLSGFNTVSDPDLMGARLEELLAFIQKLKALNPTCVIFLESAFFLSEEVKNMVFTRLGPELSLLSMNEEELASLAREVHGELDLASLPSLLSCFDQIRALWQIPGLIVHTQNYALFYGQPPQTAHLERGLLVGNLMAGYRALTGTYGSWAACRELLHEEESARGRQFRREASRLFPPDHGDAACELLVVPSRHLKTAPFTIGLGDTFAAGVQTAFLPGEESVWNM